MRRGRGRPYSLQSSSGCSSQCLMRTRGRSDFVATKTQGMRADTSLSTAFWYERGGEEKERGVIISTL